MSDAYILNIILLMQAFTLRHTSKNVRIMEDYQKILDSVKGLEEQIKWILENDPSAIDHLASMVSPTPCLCSLAHHRRSWISQAPEDGPMTVVRSAMMGSNISLALRGSP